MKTTISALWGPLSAGDLCAVPAILKREPPTLAGPLVGQQLVALLAAALEAAHRVPAHVVTSAVVEAALVDVCGQRVRGNKNGIRREMQRDKRAALVQVCVRREQFRTERQAALPRQQYSNN